MWGQAEFRGRLIAAVPVPFDAAGRMERAAHEALVDHTACGPVGGVAVWAHTGRGLRLSRADRAAVLRDWRAGLGGGRPVVAAAGAPPEMTDWARAVDEARRMAEHAAELGADALLVHPPTVLRGQPGVEERVLEYHDAVALAGLPLIVFYLYEAAGGLSYGLNLLAELLARPSVVGMKVATLDSVMTFQDVAAMVRARAPGKVLFTGEDRFFGYSLSCGAEAALVGMASAWTAPQAALLRSHLDGEAPAFLALQRRVDRFAAATFRAPMEGYVQRMLWCLVHEGVLKRESAVDPWAPPLDPDEFDHLGQLLRELGPV